MSPNVSSFVHDLVDMARAMEQLPQVQAELAAAQASNERLSQTIGDREERILNLNREIDRLNDAIRDAEGRADKAETMFLEADDRTDAYRRLVDQLVTGAQALAKAAEPAPTEPPPVAVESTEQVPAGVSDPYEQARMEAAQAVNVEAQPSPSLDPVAGSPIPSDQAPSYYAGSEQGQREPDPIQPASSTISQSPSVPSTVENEASVEAGPTEGVSVQPAPIPAPADPTGTGTVSEASSSDPEPTPRYTWQWYQWRDRQADRGPRYA